MNKSTTYFHLARHEETQGRSGAALLFYLSSFCEHFNSGTKDYPSGTIEKIRRLQKQIDVSDCQLLSVIHSYGILTDDECRHLLYYSIHGDLSGIDAVLYGSSYKHGGTIYGTTDRQ